MQAGKPALIKKDGGETLIAIVLDRPLVEAKALVEAPNAFIQAITRIMQDKQNDPVIAQMISPEVNDDPPPSESVEKAPCTDLRSHLTLPQNSYRTTQANVRQPRTPNTSAERKFTNLIKLKQYRIKRIVSPSTPTC